LTLFSDETWFRLQKYSNTQNSRYWISQNPHLLLHPVKVGVWCAVSARKIVAPKFSNETITCKRYAQVILGKLFPDLKEEEILYGWFQQDLSPAHTARSYVYASFVRCFRGQNNQQWYLASKFT
jgi:hypothetical protein